mgnify:CR=1 FL=1
MDNILKQLPELYEGIKNKDYIMGYAYIFSDNILGDYMELFVSSNIDIYECSFLIDNYPLPRKRYNTNIPYKSIEEFEVDMKRIGMFNKLKHKEIIIIEEKTINNCRLNRTPETCSVYPVGNSGCEGCGSYSNKHK